MTLTLTAILYSLALLLAFALGSIIAKDEEEF